MAYCQGKPEILMDTSRWKKEDKFPVLDLVADFRFKSASSLSFDLAAPITRDSPRPPELGDENLDWLFDRGSTVLFVLGWLDVHHPCDGIHRLQLRVGLPDRYVSEESMRDLVPQVLTALGLPAEETFYLYLAGLSERTYAGRP